MPCAALSAASLFESSFHWPVLEHFLRNLPGGSFERIASTMALDMSIFCFFVPVMYTAFEQWDVDARGRCSVISYFNGSVGEKITNQYNSIKWSKWRAKCLGSLTFCSSIILRNCSLPGCWLYEAPRPDKTSVTVGSILVLLCISDGWGRFGVIW